MDHLVSISQSVKIWVFACFCALLIWIVCMLPSSFRHFFNVILGEPDLYAGNIGMFMAAHVGLIARFFGVILALVCGFLFWGSRKTASPSKIERIVEIALFLEGTYFVLLFPSGLWWLGLGGNFLGAAYFMESILAGSTLLILSFKVRRFAFDTSVLKWIGVAAVGYIAAFWFNVVFRWFDMLELIGSEFILRGATSWGFLGSLIAMTLALVFSVPGAYFLSKNKGDAVTWFGLSLSLIGFHYIVYLAYSFSSGNLDSAMAIDVWALPFMGLGISLLLTKTNKKLIELGNVEKIFG
jgi:hypothetical protein